MKSPHILIAILLIAATGMPARAQIDPDREAIKQSLQYQLQVSNQTTAHIQEIYLTFQDSFIDYGPALEKINILINEYNKAMELVFVPTIGEKLDNLMKKLLSRAEKYFVFYKRDGREYASVNLQILEAMIEISHETRRLESLYGVR
jgi:hypothetical protein